MTSITDVLSALHDLQLGLEPQVVTKGNEAQDRAKLAPELDGICPSLACCKLLQQAALLDDNFRAKDEAGFGEHLASPLALQNLHLQLKARVFDFHIQDSAGPYTITIPALWMWQEFAKMPLASLHIRGSYAAKAAGSGWFLQDLQALGRRLQLQHFEALVAKIDASHIDDDVDDIDLHLQMAPHCDSSIRLENHLIYCLVWLHHEQMDFTLTYNSKCDETFHGLYQFLHVYSHPQARLGICQVQIACQIPWLKNCSLSPIQLQHIAAILDLPGPPLHHKTTDIACRFLFNRTYVEMKDFFIKAKAFKEYHPIESPTEIRNGQPVKLKEWFRVACKDRSNETHDHIFMYQNQVSNSRTSFQKIQIDLLDALVGKSHTSTLQATWESVIHKFFRLICWEDLSRADCTDWALFWFLVSKKYICVLAETHQLLKTKVSDAATFVKAIGQKLAGRSKNIPTLNFIFIFNAAADLSEEDLATALPPLQKYMPESCLDPLIQRVANALTSHKLSYQTLVTVLRRIALQALLSEKAILTEHCKQKAMRLEMGPYCFLFSLQIEDDLKAYAALLESATKEELECIKQILADWNYQLLPPTRTLDLNPERAFLLAHQFLESKHPDVRAEGFFLALAFPSQEAALLLLSHGPHPDTNAFLTLIRSHYGSCLSHKQETALLQLSNPLERVAFFLSIEQPAIKQLGLKIFTQEPTLYTKANAFQLATKLGTKALKLLGSINEGTTSEWIGILWMLLDKVSRDDKQAVQEYYAILELLQKCLRRMPQAKDEVKSFIFRAILKLFEEGKIYRAMTFASISSDKASQHPIAIASRLFQKLETNIALDDRAIIDTLGAVSMPETAHTALFRHLFFELANAIHAKRKHLLPQIEELIVKRLVASKLSEAEIDMKESMRRCLLACPITAWMAFCDTLPPEQILEAFDSGERLGLWEDLQAAKHCQFIARLIEKLTTANAFVIVDRLFKEANGHVFPLLPIEIQKAAKRRLKQEELEKATLSTAPALIERLLLEKQFEEAEKLCLKWLPQFTKQNKPAFKKLIQDERIHHLFANDPKAFLQLVSLSPNSVSIKQLAKYLQSHPVPNSQSAFWEPFAKLLEQHIPLALDFIHLLPSRELPLLQMIADFVVQNGSLVGKRQLFNSLGEHLKATVGQTCPLWYSLERSTLNLFLSIYCETKSSEDHKELLRILALMDKEQDMAKERLTYFLADLFRLAVQNKLLLTPELCLSIEELRKKHSLTFDTPMTENYVDLMSQSSDGDYFLKAALALLALFKNSESSVRHVLLFFTLMQRAADKAALLDQRVLDLLATLLEHYQTHLKDLVDPLELLTAINGFKGKMFLEQGIEIALARLNRFSKSYDALKQTSTLVDFVLNSFTSKLIFSSGRIIEHEAFRTSSYCPKLRNEYNSTVLVLSMMRSPLMASIAKKSYEFLQHLSSKEGPAQPPDAKLLEWVASRKAKSDHCNLSIEQIIATSYTAFVEHLILNGSYLQEFTVQKLDSYFNNVILKELHSQECLPYFSLTGTPEQQQGSLMHLMYKFINAPIENSHIKAVMLLFTWAIIFQHLQAGSIPSHEMTAYIDSFIHDERAMRDEFDECAALHNTLSRLLLQAADLKNLYHKQESKRVFLALITTQKPTNSECEKFITHGSTLSASVNHLIHLDSSSANLRAFTLMKAAKGYGIRYPSDVQLHWILKPLERLRKVHSLNQNQFHLVASIYEALVPLLPSHAHLAQFRLAWKKQTEILLRFGDVPGARQPLVIQWGLAHLSREMNHPLFSQNLAELVRQLSAWTSVARSLTATGAICIRTQAHLTYLIAECFTLTSSDPESHETVKNIVTQWARYLFEVKDPTTFALFSWLCRKAQTMPPSFKSCLGTLEPPSPNMQAVQLIDNLLLTLQI